MDDKNNPEDQFTPPSDDPAAEQPPAQDQGFSDEVPVMPPESAAFGDLDGDIGDDMSRDAGDDFIEEDWDEFDDEGDFDDEGGDGDIADPTAAVKKKSSNFNKIVIGITVVGGLIFVLMSAGGGGGPSVQDQNVAKPGQVASGPMGQIPEPQAENVSTRDMIFGRREELEQAEEEKRKARMENQNAGLLNDPSLVKDVEDETREAEFDDTYFYNQGKGEAAQASGSFPVPAEDDPPMPSPIISAGDEDTGDEVLTPLPETAGSTFGSNRSASASQDQMEDTSDDGAGDNGLADMMANNEIPRPPEDDAGDDDGFFVNTQDVMKAAQEMETASADSGNDMDDDGANPFASASASSMNASPAVGSQEAGQITEALSEIMNRLDAMEMRMDELASSRDIELDEIRASIKALGGTARAPAAATKAAAPSRSTSVAASRTTASNTAGSNRPASRASSAKWVLKSAQPGKAMLSREGDSQTYNIEVGDNLAGLGKILDIKFENSKWIVVGSKGQIVQ